MLKPKTQESSLGPSLCHLTHKPWRLYLPISPSPWPIPQALTWATEPACDEASLSPHKPPRRIHAYCLCKGFSQSVSHHMLPSLKTHQWLFIPTRLNVHILPRLQESMSSRPPCNLPSSFCPQTHQVHSHPMPFIPFTRPPCGCLFSTFRAQPKSRPQRLSP